ncbi:DnaJ-domain-containing protein [Wolfiporia cocos MD-104 SS10]|uniref:DnaJ-domain-containing protein n=1 Tax=Wolfiporia cocos (strain MD-104) TaxID=742152 RepID=A0A2H3JTI2_WOLCO|nr:DnaJ-domain-containing protein [Wolfiporia cocos MD-104 SS10]
MSKSASELNNIPNSPDDREFLYTVLNLPKTASEYEIRERYRQLSVVFHPDRQHNEETKDTATKRFLEVQKAYEVLSDPINRRAYDLLGTQGLKTVHDVDLSGIPREQLDTALIQKSQELEQLRLEKLIRPKGRLIAGIDASSLFGEVELYDYGRPWYKRLVNKLAGVRQSSFSVRHSVQSDLNEKTSVILTGRASSRGALDADDSPAALRSALTGTIRHQYSPRINFVATANLLRASNLDLKTSYQDENTTVFCDLSFTRNLFKAVSLSSSTRPSAILPFSIGFSRRLFRGSPTEGTIVFNATSAVPTLTVSVSSAHLFDYTVEGRVPPTLLGADPSIRPPSASGLSVFSSYWTVQATLAGLLSGVGGEWGIVLAELGLRVKLGLQAGLGYVNWSFGGEWRRGGNSFGANVALGLQGVILRLEGSYLGQQLSLPVTLSDDRDTGLALWTTLIPSTALILTYTFILRPRRRKERKQFFRKARYALQNEKSDLLRETKETTHLLEDIARRHMQAETSCNGLIIEEAFYGPAERDEATDGLDVNVTVPLQALVTKSQLYIPGRRSKVSRYLSAATFLSAGLQGFYDPVPGVAKALRIRYTFRGTSHYAEIPDWTPVVLPLEEHLVN